MKRKKKQKILTQERIAITEVHKLAIVIKTEYWT